MNRWCLCNLQVLHWTRGKLLVVRLRWHHTRPLKAHRGMTFWTRGTCRARHVQVDELILRLILQCSVHGLGALVHRSFLGSSVKGATCPSGMVIDESGTWTVSNKLMAPVLIVPERALRAVGRRQTGASLERRWDLQVWLSLQEVPGRLPRGLGRRLRRRSACKCKKILQRA